MLSCTFEIWCRLSWRKAINHIIFNHITWLYPGCNYIFIIYIFYFNISICLFVCPNSCVMLNIRFIIKIKNSYSLFCSFMFQNRFFKILSSHIDEINQILNWHGKWWSALYFRVLLWIIINNLIFKV